MEFFELCQNFRGNFMKQVIDDDDVVRVCTRFVAFILRMLSWSCIANPPPLLPFFLFTLPLKNKLKEKKRSEEET